MKGKRGSGDEGMMTSAQKMIWSVLVWISRRVYLRRRGGEAIRGSGESVERGEVGIESRGGQIGTGVGTGIGIGKMIGIDGTVGIECNAHLIKGK